MNQEINRCQDCGHETNKYLIYVVEHKRHVCSYCYNKKYKFRPTILCPKCKAEFKLESRDILVDTEVENKSDN